MATTKSKSSAKADTKTSRCWPGYEPVPGKGEHQEGSCRKKPASRNGGKQVDRETARKKQIRVGGKRAEQAKSKSPSATERRKARSAKAGKKSASTTRTHKTAAKRTTASTRAKKSTAKSTARRKTGTRSRSHKTTSR